MKKVVLSLLLFLALLPLLPAEQIGGDNSVSLDIGKSVSDSLRMPSDNWSFSLEYQRRLDDRFGLCAAITPRVGNAFDVSFSLGGRVYLIIADYETDFVPRKNFAVWYDWLPLYDISFTRDVLGLSLPLSQCFRLGGTVIFGPDLFIDASVGIFISPSYDRLMPSVGFSVGKRFGYSESREFDAIDQGEQP